MLIRYTKVVLAVFVTSISVIACTSNSVINPQWANYQSWQKANPEPITGASPFLGNVHRGSDGFRNIFVNDIGASVYFSDGPYEYPEGTVVVKEQTSSLRKLEEGKVDQTIMIKLAKGASPQTSDWGFARKLNDTINSGDSSDAKFCGGCHQIPATQGKDYLFTNASTF